MNELQSLLNNTPDVSLFCTALRDKLELSKLTDSITSQINEAIDAMDPKVSHFFYYNFYSLVMVYTLYGGKRNMYIYICPILQLYIWGHIYLIYMVYKIISIFVITLKYHFTFQNSISALLEQHMEELFEWCTFNPLKKLQAFFLGCPAQCIFCGVVCDSTIDCTATNRKHSSEFHRPTGFTGVHVHSTGELSYGICNFDVASPKLKFRLCKRDREKYGIEDDEFK